VVGQLLQRVGIIRRKMRDITSRIGIGNAPWLLDLCS
jgi:hypothetical protein